MTTNTSKLILLLFFSFLIFLGTLVSLDLVNRTTKEPANLVNNMKYESRKTLFYEYNIIRYPSKVLIVDLKSGERNNIIGISTDSDILDFGIVPLGNNSAKKTISLAKLENKQPLVELAAYGNISDMITFSQNNFNLKDNEKISVILNVQEDTKVGNYTGEVDIVIKTKKFG
jgi:hypothetical protein